MKKQILTIANRVKSYTVAAFFLAVVTTGAMADSNIKFNEFTFGDQNVSFLAPTDAKVTIPEKLQSLNNPLLPNGKPFSRIEWNGMIAQIDTFDVGFNFNHVDWLTAYTSIAGFKTTTTKTLKNRNGIIFGSIVYQNPASGNDDATAFLAIDGRRGMLISGFGKKSDPLVKTIIDAMKLGDPDWGKLDNTSTLDFDSRQIEYLAGYAITDASREGKPVKVISNAAKISQSANVLIVKAGLEGTHQDNVNKFNKELQGLKFTTTLARNSANEAALTLKTPDGRVFVGYIFTLNNGRSVSLITPSIEENVNYWLSGKYYYVRALRALK